MDTKKRILIADDDDIIRMLLVDSLDHDEWVIEEAENGKIAFERLNLGTFDLVIIDYMMPYLTGMDVIAQLPDNIKDNLTIIMLTAKSQQTDKDLAMTAGANHFIQKPFSPAALYELVDSLLK